jgi:hypothetical protein
MQTIPRADRQPLISISSVEKLTVSTVFRQAEACQSRHAIVRYTHPAGEGNASDSSSRRCPHANCCRRSAGNGTPPYEVRCANGRSAFFRSSHSRRGARWRCQSQTNSGTGTPSEHYRGAEVAATTSWSMGSRSWSVNEPMISRQSPRGNVAHARESGCLARGSALGRLQCKG